MYTDTRTSYDLSENWNLIIDLYGITLNIRNNGNINFITGNLPVQS